MRALNLLKEAASLYGSEIPPYKAYIWKMDFKSGAEWMRGCLVQIRMKEIVTENVYGFNAAGITKYGLAVLSSATVVFFSIVTRSLWLLWLAPIAFYLVEVQMVFLFPLLIDGERNPFKRSRLLIRLQGGTSKAMGVVLPIAWVMMFGGLFGQGFIRSWCIGCLAILLLYEKTSKFVEEQPS